MNDKIILDVINQIEPELFWLFLKLICISIGFLILRGYIENITAYIQFRSDKMLGQGVTVKVRGVKGKIINYNFAWIFVETEDSIEIISMRRWRFEKWAVINGHLKQ